jgi:hypothetical protein
MQSVRVVRLPSTPLGTGRSALIWRIYLYYNILLSALAVPILAGTDAPNLGLMFDASLLREIKYRKRIRMLYRKKP